MVVVAMARGVRVVVAMVRVVRVVVVAAAATVAVVVVGVHAHARRPSLYSSQESYPFAAVFRHPLVRAKRQR
jgi:hypothetical protein